MQRSTGEYPMKAVRTDRELECPDIDAGLRARGVDLVTLPADIPQEELMREVAEADLLLMCYTPITAPVIAAARRLKGIVKYGVGIDAIDIPAAMARGIPVVNVPDYAQETVAEAAFALMIALAKRLPEIGRAMERDGWLWPEPRWLGHDIAGATVGLVGMGKIGRSMARMASSGFRARVLGFDPHVEASVMAGHGVEKADDLHAMLRQCDFVSLHTALSPSTRHLIDRAALACMKPSAVLVNVSRGALVDEAALVEALLAGRLGSVGLDVYEEEPLAKTGHTLSPLFGRPDAILLPHLAFFTAEAMQRLTDDTLARCFEILDGKPVEIRSHDPRLRAQECNVRFA